jgi:hypothetical protein
MLELQDMNVTRRRYTTVDTSATYIVAVAQDPTALARKHWFEAHITVTDEQSGKTMALPPFIETYRIGEPERPFRDVVNTDFDGDQEAALSHQFDTIFRRVYQFIERGH